MPTTDPAPEPTQRARHWIVALYELTSEAAARCFIRVTLWIITIVGALAPPLYAASVRPSLDITAIAAKVNEAGLFRDVFYVTVVIALIGICEILAVLFKGKKLNPLVAIIYSLSFLVFIYLVIFGIGEFAHLVAPHGEVSIVPKEQFEYDLSLLVSAGIIGLGLELVLAFQGE